MIAGAHGKKSLTVTEFKAHCTEELRAVETGVTLEITRHGKVIAVVTQPETSSVASLREWSGSGAGLMTRANFDEPTWTAEEWEEFPHLDSDDSPPNRL